MGPEPMSGVLKRSEGAMETEAELGEGLGHSPGAPGAPEAGRD